MNRKFFSGFFAAAIFAVVLSGCNFVGSFSAGGDSPELSFSTGKCYIPIGGMDVVELKLSEKQNTAKVTWFYDSSIIHARTDNYSAVITGLSPGSTLLSATSGSNSVACMVTVTSDRHTAVISNPYVYASHDYVEVLPRQTVKISASMFGGTSADVEGFTFRIDKPSVASLHTQGNYCWITGVSDGLARVTVGHARLSMTYSVLVNCTSDGTVVPYITTETNVVTINLSENVNSEIIVDMVNPLLSDYESGFEASVVGFDGAEISPFDAPVEITSMGGRYIYLRANSAGECYVRVTNLRSEARYPLDVLVRVIENADIAYIEPSSTLLVVGGDVEQVDVKLVNYEGDFDPNKFHWSFPREADELVFLQFPGFVRNTGDILLVSGKKTGSFKATVSYEGLGSRDIVILVRNIVSSAKDANVYLTTSQNYFRLPMDGGEQSLKVVLNNCDPNIDRSLLKWTVTHQAKDGSAGDVIRWVTGQGAYVNGGETVGVRAVSEFQGQTVDAWCSLEPLREGMATIMVSHPKALYPLHVTVAVGDVATDAVDRPLLTASGSNVVMVRNSDDALTVTSVFLAARNFSTDEHPVTWKVTDGTVQIVPASDGLSCQVLPMAAGTEARRHVLQASVDSLGLRVLFDVYTFENSDDLGAVAVPAIFSSNLYMDGPVGGMIELYVETFAVDDLSRLSWRVKSGDGIVSLETVPDDKKSCVVHLDRTGEAEVAVSYPGAGDLIFYVRSRALAGVVPDYDCYMSSDISVLYFDGADEARDLRVTHFNISDAYWGLTEWRYEGDAGAFEVSGNGDRATVRSLLYGAEGVLVISHPQSLNTLRINLKCGEQFVFDNENISYISVSVDDTLVMYEGQKAVDIYAVVEGTDGEVDYLPQDFVFSCDSIDVVSINSWQNVCSVTPKKNGTCRITVRHPSAKFGKDIVVVVRLPDDSTAMPYITTNSNVLTVIQGQYAQIGASLVNLESFENDKWKWRIEDSGARIASVVTSGGQNAMIAGLRQGVARLVVSHEECPYELYVVVQVLDAGQITSRPYIKTSEDIVTVAVGGSATFNAEMVGGVYGADENSIQFSNSNSGVAFLSASSGRAYVRGMTPGMCYVTVTNPRYGGSQVYSKQVLVIVEDSIVDDVYIDVSESVMKMRPGDGSVYKITASLVNGSALDGANFIWWADDYGMIVAEGYGEVCYIQTTGRTGVTKVHVRHEKSLHQADILIIVSNYDSLAFSKNAMSINAGQLYFVAMQVPSIEEDFTVTYESSNENVCLTDGTKGVVWLSGVGFGHATITARIVSSSGDVLDSAEMLVTVTVPERPLPVISLGNTLLTVEVGTSKQFQAVISGDYVDPSENYSLRWEVQNNDDFAVDFLNSNDEGILYGSDCYMTFNREGEYIVTVTHERTGATTDLYLNVIDRGAVGIMLSPTSIVMSKDDGSVTITATLINGSAEDYKTIEWSSTKQQGVQVVSVSRTKGQKCTVVPKNAGAVSVIARLPNGVSAVCPVTVKPSAEIVFATQTLRIIPGYSANVKYTKNPPGALVTQWLTQMNSQSFGSVVNYFSVSDNPAKSEIVVQGLLALSDGQAAGTIQPLLVGASSTSKITVYCDYTPQLEVLSMDGLPLSVLENKNPDSSNVTSFRVKYYPVDLDVDMYFDDTLFRCLPASGQSSHKETPVSLFRVQSIQKEFIVEDSLEKCVATVTLSPASEGEGKVKITGRLPTDTAGVYKKESTFKYEAYYDKYDIVPDISYTQVGAYSRYDSNSRTIYLGDGEEVHFRLSIGNENASGSLGKIQWIADGSYEGGELGPPVDYSGDYSSNTNERDLRFNLAKKIFGIREERQLSAIGDGTGRGGSSYRAGQSLISLSTATLSNGVTEYVLRHNWDFYKDLPVVTVQDVKTGGNLTLNLYHRDQWVTFYQNVMYRNDIRTLLQAYDLRWFIVEREPTYGGAHIIHHRNVAYTHHVWRVFQWWWGCGGGHPASSGYTGDWRMLVGYFGGFPYSMISGLDFGGGSPSMIPGFSFGVGFDFNYETISSTWITGCPHPSGMDIVNFFKNVSFLTNDHHDLFYYGGGLRNKRYNGYPNPHDGVVDVNNHVNRSGWSYLFDFRTVSWPKPNIYSDLFNVAQDIKTVNEFDDWQSLDAYRMYEFRHVYPYVMSLDEMFGSYSNIFYVSKNAVEGSHDNYGHQGLGTWYVVVPRFNIGYNGYNDTWIVPTVNPDSSVVRQVRGKIVANFTDGRKDKGTESINVVIQVRMNKAYEGWRGDTSHGTGYVRYVTTDRLLP